MADITSADLAEAERYLRSVGWDEDRWILDEGSQWLRVGELEGRLFGLAANSVSKLAQTGQFPGAVLPSQQAGWRIPRSGVIYYIAQRRRETERQFG
jgi:hypothetical protein